MDPYRLSAKPADEPEGMYTPAGTGMAPAVPMYGRAGGGFRIGTRNSKRNKKLP